MSVHIQDFHSGGDTSKISIKNCDAKMCQWHELFFVGSKIPNRRAYHISFFWKNEFFIYGGQDLKDGCFGDMWKVDLSFLGKNDDETLYDGNEIENQGWQPVTLKGKYPKSIVHHQGALQDSMSSLIIYGGLMGVDSSDSIYVVDLNTFNFEMIPAKDQTEKNKNQLPGPRDDFCFVTIDQELKGIKPMYLIGGFKNGMKMNDIYKLHYIDKQFVWEYFEIANKKSVFEPRSAFDACCQTGIDGKESVFIFGGSGDNNEKYNDLWEFDGTQWIEHKQGQDQQDRLPLEKSGHSISLYKNRYILVFGGIHEITAEMNDLRMYDTKKKQWSILDEENKNASENGSPKQKLFMQQQESFKKASMKMSHGKGALKSSHADSPMNNTGTNFKNHDDSYSRPSQNPRASDTFNNGNPFLSVKVRSLSRRKRGRTQNKLQKDQMKKHHPEVPGTELLTPTSISMKNAFIVKNADASFDHYFHLMKKRRSPAPGSPLKINQISPNNTFFGNHQASIYNTNLNLSAINNNHKEDATPRIRINADKQPPGRDGHCAQMRGHNWIIFGGDRHHMPFNDTYVLNLEKLNLDP